MGCSDDKINENEERPQRRRIHQRQNYQEDEEPEEEEEEEFKDFEELGNGKMIGEGVKKIPSYKCKIPYDKLNDLRVKFWKSRKNNKRVWKAIRECCESDANTAVILLEAAEMACVNSDLRQVIELANPNYIYKVPNFCVCDPIFERDYDKIKEKNKGIESVKIKIVLFYLAKNKNIKLNATNKTHVKKIKEAFAKKMELDLKNHKIRLLFRGQELLDENPLYYNNVEDGSKIQVMVNKI